MTWELAFTTANVVAGGMWLPMLLAPRSRLTARWIATPAGPLVLAVVYAALAVRMMMGDGEGGMGSLAEVRAGFASDPVLLLGWVHYLCFDLFVGQWATRDAARLGLNPWLVAPCLLLTFLLGPVGLLLYLALRLASRRTFRIVPKIG